jgi:hypothetical protein
MAQLSDSAAIDAPSATRDTTEKPLVRPHLAFSARSGQVRRRGRRSAHGKAESHPARQGKPTISEARLAWALADAVSVCFTAHDHLAIYTALGAGETRSAIERMLDVSVRTRYPLPAKLTSTLATWLDGTVTLSSSRQLGESVSEHCYAVLQGPPLPGRDH